MGITSKVSVKGYICKEKRPTLHVTCRSDVIGGMSAFSSEKSNTQDSDWCVKVSVIFLIG